MNDYMSFRRMITPVLIQLFFWIGVAGIVITGLAMMFGGENAGERVLGFLLIPFGVLMVRIYCELLILLFRINDSLQDIRRSVLGTGSFGSGSARTGSVPTGAATAPGTSAD